MFGPVPEALMLRWSQQICFVLRGSQHRQRFGYVAALLLIAVVTAALKLIASHINPTTVALALFLSRPRGDPNLRY
jgi:hypothetical protein